MSPTIWPDRFEDLLSLVDCWMMMIVLFGFVGISAQLK